jgi:hypothetical protein
MGQWQDEFETAGEIWVRLILELVADPENRKGLKLLSWDGKTTKIQRTWRIKFHGEKRHNLYIPATINSTVLRAIYLPQDAASYGSTRELFDSLCSLLKKFVLFSDNHVVLLAHSVLASWVVEYTGAPITVALVGPDGPVRRQVFRLLHCLFRRALMLNTANVANLFALPMDLKPSLFITRCEPCAALRAFLNATSFPGSHFAAKGQLVNFSCAKVFATDEPLRHFLEGFPVVEIPVASSLSSAPFLDHQMERKILEEYQPKLLMYRLLNLLQIRDWHFDGIDLETPWRDVTECLAATAASDAQLQANVVELVKTQEASFQADSGTLFRKSVLEALLTLCHQATENALTVGKITQAANQLLSQGGEILTLEPRGVVDILRSLQIPTERVGAQGRGIALLKETKRHLHAIAMDYGIDFPNTDPRDCQICSELDPEYGSQNPSESITPADMGLGS